LISAKERDKLERWEFLPHEPFGKGGCDHGRTENLINSPLFFPVDSSLRILSPLLPAFGQDFPVKPITLYCGYEAGATTDVTARGLAAGAEKLLGVPVVVENKAGGGGAGFSETPEEPGPPL
jgi:hypothetical protein